MGTSLRYRPYTRLKRAARLTCLTCRKRFPSRTPIAPILAPIRWTTTFMHSKIRFVMTSIIIRDVWGVEAAELLNAQIAQSRIAQARQFLK